MNFLNKSSFIILLSLLGLSACNSIKDIEYLGIKDTKLESIGLKKGTIKIVLEYLNPNKFGLDIKETQLEVYVNEQYVGIAENASQSKVPSAAKFDFPVYVHFNPLQALGMAKLVTAKDIKLQVKGSTKVGKAGVFIRVPVNVTEMVNIN